MFRVKFCSKRLISVRRLVNSSKCWCCRERTISASLAPRFSQWTNAVYLVGHGHTIPFLISGGCFATDCCFADVPGCDGQTAAVVHTSGTLRFALPTPFAVRNPLCVRLLPEMEESVQSLNWLAYGKRPDLMTSLEVYAVGSKCGEGLLVAMQIRSDTSYTERCVVLGPCSWAVSVVLNRRGYSRSQNSNACCKTKMTLTSWLTTLSL